MGFYKPTGARTEKFLAAARVTNEKRDQADISYGFAPPLATDFSVFLTTVLSALNAGIERKDWSCIAEAMDMLLQAEKKMKQDMRVDRN